MHYISDEAARRINPTFGKYTGEFAKKCAQETKSARERKEIAKEALRIQHEQWAELAEKQDATRTSKQIRQERLLDRRAALAALRLRVKAEKEAKRAERARIREEKATARAERMIRRNERAAARAERLSLWNEQAISKVEDKEKAVKAAEEKVLAAKEFSKAKKLCEHGKHRKYCRDCGGLKVWAQNLLSAAQSRARRDGLPCDLDVEWIAERLEQGCPIFKFPFSATNSNKGDRSTSPSIDKFYPHLGYTKENSFMISFFANSIKTNATTEQVFAVANWMQFVEAKLIRA